VRHIRHVREHLPFEHRIVLNANEEMHAALRAELPDAFEYDPAAHRGPVLCHPRPLDKRRFHGSLLQGIVRNIDLAARRWEFEAVLVLSSRSWFRRALSLDDVRHARARMPMGVRKRTGGRAALHHTSAGGARRTRIEPCDSRGTRPATALSCNWEPVHSPPPARARRAVRFRDVSDSSISGFEMAADTAGGAAVSVGTDWRPIMRSRLVSEVLRGCTLLQGPHEGLLLEAAACEHALRALDGPAGDELWSTEGALEEFVLQSLAHSQGLRFAQLSDMGEREGLDNGIDATGEHLTPLTKTERRV
jgi:hypothetical protein